MMSPDYLFGRVGGDQHVILQYNKANQTMLNLHKEVGENLSPSTFYIRATTQKAIDKETFLINRQVLYETFNV